MNDVDYLLRCGGGKGSPMKRTHFLSFCDFLAFCSFLDLSVLSRASAHGHLQLKHKKIRVGSCTEEVLELFDYPHSSAHP